MNSNSGTPTHKKLDPTMVSSRGTLASGAAGSVGGASAAAPQRPVPPAQTPPPPPQPPVQQPPTQSYQSNPMGTPPATGNGVPGQRNFTTNGSLPSRALPVMDDPDDEVDVPPFMRR